MLDGNKIVDLLSESMASLRRSGVVTADIEVRSDTVLFGSGSSLDSIGFVTFVTDVEERLNRTTGKDLYVVLTDLEELYPGAAELTAGMLANYLLVLSSS